ncbi:MAG: type II toxin-antitoxin system prevent-host-death family antitoxin [Spirochaetae bacterium HGW-Spirochaetae-8]|nr:MAG: type II toxin-antitoxin system prevent-host-death family antitoxin [Spirochaetae bacterium HGW-Spirochaetae-8]
MKITTKELRIQPGKILNQVVGGNEVTVTYRGKAIVKIIPIESNESPAMHDKDGIFGMWSKRKEDKSPEELVRELRKGRSF